MTKDEKRKHISKLLYDFAAIVDKQTEKRKVLDWQRTTYQKTEEEYQALTQQLADIEEKIKSYVVD